MRNLNKKQNLVEQARIKLDKEKISHSITRVRVEKLENIIKEAREYIEDNTYKANETEYMDLTGIKELLEILQGSDKE